MICAFYLKIKSGKRKGVEAAETTVVRTGEGISQKWEEVELPSLATGEGKSRSLGGVGACEPAVLGT